MGAFDKKKAFGIGGILTGAAAVIAVLANLSEIIQLFKGDDKPEKSSKSVAVVETVTEQLKVTEAIKVTEPYVVEESYVEEEIIEENVIVTEEIIEPETEPPTEPQPVSIYINDLQYMSCKNIVGEQIQLKDNIGNMHHNGLIMWKGNSRGEGSADYYIQGQYTTFSGTVAVPSGYEGNENSAFFEVYGDNNLLYTSPVMTNTSFPEDFSIDITGVQLLTISYPESNSRVDMATLYDGLLS